LRGVLGDDVEILDMGVVNFPPKRTEEKPVRKEKGRDWKKCDA